jgi:hypothetical protein
MMWPALTSAPEAIHGMSDEPVVDCPLTATGVAASVPAQGGDEDCRAGQQPMFLEQIKHRSQGMIHRPKRLAIILRSRCLSS